MSHDVVRFWLERHAIDLDPWFRTATRLQLRDSLCEPLKEAYKAIDIVNGRAVLGTGVVHEVKALNLTKKGAQWEVLVHDIGCLNRPTESHLEYFTIVNTWQEKRQSGQRCGTLSISGILVSTYKIIPHINLRPYALFGYQLCKGKDLVFYPYTD
ncbi:hypothetical protein VNO77_03348 [Canavalia gladiata]|uniref:Uncharacterized protein n=1 Tax=Canavalia gladiata TaxID=3824 RepID=A0AAN9N100_CANGL